MVSKCLESFGMIWNKLIIKDPNFEFEVHVIEPWKTRFYVIRSLFLNIKSRPKNRFVSITYHFFQQNFVRYFCMHLLYPPRLVLSWYLKISYIEAIREPSGPDRGKSSPDLVPNRGPDQVPTIFKSRVKSRDQVATNFNFTLFCLVPTWSRLFTRNFVKTRDQLGTSSRDQIGTNLLTYFGKIQWIFDIVLVKRAQINLK